MFFEDIIGQKEAKGQLIRSVIDGRISHAQLFIGPKGSGNLPMAIAYARYISCENRKEQDSCGECVSCIKYNKLVHPDLHFVYPSASSKDDKNKSDTESQWREQLLSNPYITLYDWFEALKAENKQAVITVNDSALVLKKLSLTTYETEYKIVIIWHADKMNPAAANKLLKILEEPPEKTLFLLVCESEDQLLSTIISRTQRIKLTKIKQEELVAALIEKNNLSKELAENIAIVADGDYSEALLLIDENESINQYLLSFQQFMRSSLKFDPKSIVSWADDNSKLSKERQKGFLKYALHIIRESLIINNKVQSINKLTDKEIEFVTKFSPFIHDSNIEQFMNELNDAFSQIERNANSKILFMDLSFKFNELLNLPRTVS